MKKHGLKLVSAVTPLLLCIGARADENANREQSPNLLPYFGADPETPPQRMLFWRHNRKWAVRDKDWKLFKGANRKHPELIHISQDMSEKTNLIDKKPEVAKRLRAAYDKWNSEMIPPQWGWQPDLNGKYRVED